MAGREGLTVLKLTETINLSFSSYVSAACYPTCNDMFDVEFQNGTGISLKILQAGCMRAISCLILLTQPNGACGRQCVKQQN